MSDSVSIEGTATSRYGDSSDCICCPGNHVYGYNLELDHWTDRDYRNHADDWFYEAIRRMPEGSRVRVTVEALSEPTTTKGGALRSDDGGRTWTHLTNEQLDDDFRRIRGTTRGGLAGWIWLAIVGFTSRTLKSAVPGSRAPRMGGATSAVVLVLRTWRWCTSSLRHQVLS